MKRTIKTMLLFVAGALVLASCTEDLNPPVAGFTVSNETPTQWDMATITSTATGATETTYAITPATFEMDDATGTIQFLDADTYSISQTVTNADGTTESSQEITVTAPDNSYNMSFYGDAGLAINGDAYWFSATQIRLNGEGTTAQETDNTIKTTIDAGLDPFHGAGTRNYAFDGAGGSGTYIGEFTNYPATGDAWDAAWGFGLTSAGEGLEVTLIYAPEGAADETDYVYDITMSNTTIDGYYDGGFGYNDGPSSLTFTYRGKITPFE